MKKKIHYSWIMVFISGLLMFGMSAQQMSHSVFLPNVAESLGVGMGSASLAYSTSSYMMILLAPVAAKLFSAYSTRILCLIAAAGQVCSLLILSTAQSLFMVVTACVFESFTISCFLGVLSSTIIKRWFTDRGQFAYNLILFLSMMGGVVFTPVAGTIIEYFDWRTAYRVLAAFVVVVELPVVFFFMHDHPSQLGLAPYEDSGAAGKGLIQNRPTRNKDMTAKSAWRSGTFYLVCLYALALGYAASMQNHMVKHLSVEGYSSAIATTAVSAGMVGGLAGRVVLSVISEKIGLKRSNAIYCCVGIFSAVMLCGLFRVSPWMIVVMGFLYGLAARVSTVLSSLMKYRIFSASEDYTKIVANITVVTGIATASSNTVFGYIYDFTGSYLGGFLLVICTFTISIVLSNMLLKTNE